MPTPPKPFEVLKMEKRSHRTKEEMKKRKQGEESLSTGVALKERSEVRSNPIAHKEFKRLNELLRTIGKNDAIYETIINRYCTLQAECSRFEESISVLGKGLEELEVNKDSMDVIAYFRLLTEMEKAIDSKDRQLQAKRKMLFDIEKENIMTIAAALRSIPKKEDKSSSPLLEALKGG